MKKKLISLVLLAILLTTTFSVIPGTYAASEEDIEASIALGLSWLAGQQNVNGYWGTGNRVARTGLAVLKFIDRVNELEDIDSPFDDTYIYKDQVVDGLNYILSQQVTIAISNQTAGDPDSNGNGDGVYFIGHQVYETSIALMALGSAAVYNSSYLPIVQDVTDFMAYAQNDAGDDRGGWGYTANDYQWSDNSVSGYAALGIGYAQQAGAIIPDFVKTELVYWIDFIQMDNGGSGYGSSPIGGGYYYNYGDILLKTGNLLYEMALVGMPVDDPNVTAALTYIEDNWALGGDLYQRAYCLMKGLEAYGIEGEINVGASGDWFNETSTFIVNNQNPDGSWPRDSHDVDSPYAMTAAWALLTLEKAVAIPDKTPLGMKEDAREILVSHLGLYDKHVEHDIEQAIWHIDKSMDPDLWVDDSHLEWQHGNKVFDEEKLAVKELLHIVEWKDASQAAIDMAYEVILILVEADEKLATVQYDEATAYAGAHEQVDHQLELALEEFANAADELTTIKKGHPKYDDAINAYNKAWQHAGLAIKHATK